MTRQFSSPSHFFLLPAHCSESLCEMQSISIKPILPLSLGDPRTITTQIVPFKNISRALATLRPNPTSSVGVTLLIAKGRVKRVVLATTSRLVLFTVDSTPSQADREVLQAWLDSDVTIAGYHMAPMSLHLWRDLGCRLLGRDLTTFKIPMDKPTALPSDHCTPLGGTKGYSQSALNNLWETSFESDLCHRAWVCAM